MRRVQPWRAPCGFAVLGEVALLSGLDAAVGLGTTAWVGALGALLVVVLLLGSALARERALRLGPANQVTLTRAVLVCAVAGLGVDPSTGPSSRWAVALLAGPALALDAVDGRLARRTRSVSRLGARFDMETDALLVLALSAYVARELGWWVLLIGLARYLLLGAQAVWPSLRGEGSSRRWRKVVAAIQGVTLVVAATQLAPRGPTVAALAGALALLVASFVTEVWERLGRRTTADTPAPASGWRGAVVTVLAVILVWIALTAPSGGSHPSPWLLVRVPVEGMVLLGAVLLLPRRWGDGLAALFGVLAAVLLALKVVNVGFAMVLDRSFDPVGDWGYLGAAVGVLADSVGQPVAVATAALAGCLALTLCVALPVATLRVTRVARRRRSPTVGLVVGVLVLALSVAATGVAAPRWGSGLSAASFSLALQEAREVPAALHDRSVFAEEITNDPFAGTPGHQLLQRLRGKDVLVVFVESYGRSAVEHSSYAPGVDAVLDASTRRLASAGYASRSAFLTSPTFGAGSWLAHSTVQSGLWVDSQRRYDQLLSSHRLTLTEAFGKAGWRTVFDVPANTRDWPSGADFYRFDTLYDSRNVGYRGPRFDYATMPDQYTLSRFRARELAASRREPVMAEIDLVSSHHPWAPLPSLVPWGEVGDGSVFDGMPQQAASAAEVFSDPDRVRRAYGQSIEYSVEALVSFLATYRDDLVVLMLGDHEPHHYVSGDDPGHDVPVTLIARDPRVVADISAWGWSPGMRPSPGGPVWRMDTLRDRFLSTFSTGGLHRPEPNGTRHRAPG